MTRPTTAQANGTPPADRVISMGCRLNIAESARIETLLSATPAATPRIVINGCGVTNEAMRQTRVAARRAHRDNPDATVIVTGCAAQIDPASFAAMPEVAQVLGNREKLDQRSYAHVPTERVAVGQLAALARTAPQFLALSSGHARAFVEVQNGCDHSCTFCIIPAGRGAARSVDADALIAGVSALLANDQREIVLTGVDITSWGQDLPGTPRLGQLCTALLDAIPDLARLRLGSLDVAELDDELFALLTTDPRMMPHVHLSLQHGDDLILKRMKRRHSRAQAIAMVERLKTARPAMAIGADLIAGFPTENDAAAQQSLSLLDACDVVFAHIFPYSARVGTPAARMPQVDGGIIRARAAALRHHAAARQALWLERLIGTEQHILVERDGLSGHAGNFARVALASPATPGAVERVRITARRDDRLIGNISR